MDNIGGKISDAEWLVMKVIWQQSPLPASSVVELLKVDTDWSPKTIQTLIGRLVKKGALGVDKESNPFRYYPLLSQEECMRGQTESFLKKVYEGSFHLLLANFVSNENMSSKEIQELRDILDGKIKS